MTIWRLMAALPLLAAGAVPARTAETPVADATALSRDLANQFQQELGGALASAIEAGGAASAVGVCATIAPAVAQRLSAESGAQVRRTSLGARNALAMPDAHEARVMRAMAEAPLGADGKPVEAAGWTGPAAERRFRYVRAIPTAPMCLSCHGTSIAPDVAAQIRAAYPGDRATGFAAGQMRGAFSISWSPSALAAARAK
jgi:hypothetical protein